MRSLRDQRVLVTGAGRGIGRVTALELARHGAEVVVTDLRLADAERTAEEIRAGGARAHAFELNVTDTAAIERLREQLHSRLGPIQVLVNNAGTVFGGAFLDVPIEKHALTYQINLVGLVAVTHAFLPDLIAAREGHIVNIVSASAFVGLPFGTTYASSKWGALGFSESLRLELDVLGHRHVGITAVCPGYVNTGLFNGVKPPRMTRMLEPEELARQIARAVQRNRPILITPRITHIAPALRGLVPTSWMDQIGRFFGVSTSMMHWRGHDTETLATQNDHPTEPMAKSPSAHGADAAANENSPGVNPPNETRQPQRLTN